MCNFNWEQYLKNYPDLYHSGITTEEKVKQHYIKYGRHEGRKDTPLDIINSSFGLGGRFGNTLFYNFVADYFAKKFDLKFEYRYLEEMKELNIHVYQGTKTYPDTITLTDTNIDTFFEKNPIENSNILLRGYFQTPVVARYIKEIIPKTQEQRKETVFIHVRLGDIIGIHEDYSYYNSILSNLDFKYGFISSDTIKHSICQRLIEKYNLFIFRGNETETLKFGSSCEYLILSKGTFSWFMGVLSKGTVYYPERIGGKVWHGDIFCFSDWNKILY